MPLAQEDDDLPAGIRLLDVPGAQRVQPRDEQLDFRNPCDEPGLPISGKASTRSLTEDEQKWLGSEQQRQAEAELSKAVLSADPLQTLVWSSLQSVVTCVLVVASLAFVLFVVSHVVQTLAALSQLPAWLRLPGYGGLAALGMIALFYVSRVALLYVRLKRNEQLKLSALRALQDRESLRQLARDQRAEAVTRLRSYINGYPLADAAQQRFLLSCGLTLQDLEELKQAAVLLSSDEDRATWESWMADFCGRYQGVLDRVAEQQINGVARLVGVKTAISPNPLVDSAIVVYSGFALLGTLCQIYNLRLGPLGMLRLAGSVFSHAYLAGRLEEMPVEDWLSDAVNKSLASFGKSSLSLVGKTIGLVTAPVFQGTGNGMLILRLGRHTQRLLRPVEPQT